MNAPNVQLEQGEHVVRVVFDTGGVNLNWLRFDTCTDACSPGQGTAGAGGMPTSAGAAGATSGAGVGGSGGMPASGSAGTTSTSSGGSSASGAGAGSGAAGGSPQLTPSASASDSSGCAVRPLRAGDAHLTRWLWLAFAVALLRKKRTR